MEKEWKVAEADMEKPIFLVEIEAATFLAESIIYV